MANTLEIYITLLEEGTPTMRGTQAVNLGEGRYKVMPIPFYDPEDEIWEFPPGSIVKCKPVKDDANNIILLAYEAVH